MFVEPRELKRKNKEKLEKTVEKFYVYRFLNKDGVVVYVGRTKNLSKRFHTHEHLTEDVDKVEYIECLSEAEMAWKEIYYINLFYNELSTNSCGVYSGGEKLPDMQLDDKWHIYNYFRETKTTYDVTKIMNDYNTYMKDIPKYDYKTLIHILYHNKLNSIGKDKYDLSEKWFRENLETGLVDKLRKHLKNLYINIFPVIYEDCWHSFAWTSYGWCKNLLKSDGNTRKFVFIDKEGILIPDTAKICVAYLRNDFLPVAKEKPPITDEEYALLPLFKFLFTNSALKNGKDIYLYLPSKRMRDLLTEWIEANSFSEAV